MKEIETKLAAKELATNVQNKLYNAMVEQLKQLQKLNADLTKEISEERLNHQHLIESLDDDKRRLYNYNLKKLTKDDHGIDYLDSPKPV
jgi:hypothetical protein